METLSVDNKNRLFEQYMKKLEDQDNINPKKFIKKERLNTTAQKQ